MLRRRAVSLLRTGWQSQQAGCRAADTAAVSEVLAAAAALRPQVQSRVWQQCHQQLRRQHGGWHSDNRHARLAHTALHQTCSFAALSQTLGGRCSRAPCTSHTACCCDSHMWLVGWLPGLC